MDWFPSSSLKALYEYVRLLFLSPFPLLRLLPSADSELVLMESSACLGQYNIDFTFAQSPAESSFANAFQQEAGVAVSGDAFVTDQRFFPLSLSQSSRSV